MSISKKIGQEIKNGIMEVIVGDTTTIQTTHSTGQTQIVPFSFSEADIRKNFLDWVILGDSTPIDVAFKANITKVEKQLFPVRLVEANWQAIWTATCFWEHEEKYVEREQRKRNNGEIYYVNVNKKKTVIDNIEHVANQLNDLYSDIIVTLEKKNDAFADWLKSISIKRRTDATEQNLADGTKMPLTMNDEYAEQQVIPEVQSLAIDACKAKIPGTRYEDFKVYDLTADITVTTIYLPVYKISYEYDGKSYTSWLSGSEKDSGFANHKPTDGDLVSQKKIYDDKIAKKKRPRLIAGIFDFAVIPIIFIIILVILGNIIGYAVLLPLALAVILEIVLIRLNFLPAHRAVKACIAEMETYLGDLMEKRKKIAAIVKQDQLTVEEQKQKISEVLHISIDES